LVIQWLSVDPLWVESKYSKGLFPVISQLQRILTAWLPFSVGDLLYLILLVWLISKTAVFFRDLFRRRVNIGYLKRGAQRFIFFILFLYIFFNLLWGLNYSRAGIGHQLQVVPDSVSASDVGLLTEALLAKAIRHRAAIPDLDRKNNTSPSQLFTKTGSRFQQQTHPYSLGEESPVSIKSSLFGSLGNYLGVEGYYNPFTGESQVNTTIPVVLQPFVALHEVAHQAGYAKESEANFVAYLAGKEHPDPLFRYSVYLQLFRYSYAELYRLDSNQAHRIMTKVSPEVKQDLLSIRKFYQSYQTPVDAIISKGYDYFLRANQQPHGTWSYHQVTGWIIALVRKKGIEVL